MRHSGQIKQGTDGHWTCQPDHLEDIPFVPGFAVTSFTAVGYLREYWNHQSHLTPCSSIRMSLFVGKPILIDLWVTTRAFFCVTPCSLRVSRRQFHTYTTGWLNRDEPTGLPCGQSWLPWELAIPLMGKYTMFASWHVPSGNLTYLLKIAIYSGFTHQKWWFSIVMLNYQRVCGSFLKRTPKSSMGHD